MPDALLLDWEGCIVDTSAMRQLAAQRALRDEGLPPETAATMDPVIAGLLAARTSRAFAERLGKGFAVREGVREFLEHAQLSARIAIVTQATRAETEFVLRLAGLESIISTVVSADDEPDALPSARPFIAAIAQLSKRRATRPDQCIAIGTSADAIRSARTAALRTIALGAPAHVAVEADGAVDSLVGLSMSALARTAGLPVTEHSA